MKSRDWTVWDAADAVRRAQSLADIAAITQRYCRSLGFDRHGFAMSCAGGQAHQSGYHYFHNIPEPWGRYRYELTYATSAANKDPLIQHLSAGLPPTAFSRTGIVTHTRPDVIRRGTPILQRAGDNGISAGVLAPLRAPGMNWGFLVLTTDDTDAVGDVLPELPNAYLFAQFVLNATRDLHGYTSRKPPALTRRERETLSWAALGKSSWEIGRIASCSEKTVDFHLANAARKLDVRGRRAAVARAVALGVIAI